MRKPMAFGSSFPARAAAFIWGGLAVLTCPCHLPLLLAITAGSSFAALLNENLIITGTILTGLFLLCLSSALRAFRRIS